VLTERHQVGKRIRDLRTDRGLSQERLAHAAGIARDTVYRTENGTYSVSLDTLILIAHALRVPAARLLEDPNE
jgi:transcriptional regulator with XRE-family HTH domain